MRFLIATALVLSCSLCLAEDLPRNTDEFKSLTAEQAAELVKKYKGGSLFLRGLTSIDKDVAKELANFEGLVLGLNGLTSIDKDVAQELAYYQGVKLTLGLKSIDKESLQELARLKSRVYLGNFTSIDKDIAQFLIKFHREELVLGLTSIDKEVAKELAKFKGSKLRFIRLKKIDKDVAQELAKFKGTHLDLYSLTSIDKDVAKGLAKFEGPYLFCGLTSIDKDVAQELVEFKGSRLRLMKVSSIAEDALPILWAEGNSIALPLKFQDPASKVPRPKSIYVEIPPYVGNTYVTEIKNKVGSHGTHTATVSFGDATTIKPNPRALKSHPYIIPFQFHLDPPHPCLPRVYQGYGEIESYRVFRFRSEPTFWNRKRSEWSLSVSFCDHLSTGIEGRLDGTLFISYYPQAGGTNLKLNFSGVQDEQHWDLK